jgi:hypothetical protein
LPSTSTKPAEHDAIWQVPALQLVLATLDVGGQSAAVQHAEFEMHFEPHTFCPDGQLQLPPGPEQISPLIIQSESLQHVPSLMHELLDVQACVPDGHEQVPPSPLHFCPVTVQSLLMQQEPSGLHCLKVGHSCWPVGHWHDPIEQISPATFTVQSASTQQFADGMHCVPHAFWFIGHAHVEPGEAHVSPVTPAQSVLSQQDSVGMQVIPERHVRDPLKQLHLRPGFGQTCPRIAPQSAFVQHVPSAMQLADC